MQLISNWRQFWRFSSVWFQAAAAAFFTYLMVVPDALIQIWQILPLDIRAAVPPQYVQGIGVALIALGTVARIVKQRSLARGNDGLGAEGEPNVSQPDRLDR